MPLILLGLRLLGTHFAWARRANVRVEEAARESKHWWHQLAWPIRLAITVAVLLVLGLFIWWWLGS